MATEVYLGAVHLVITAPPCQSRKDRERFRLDRPLSRCVFASIGSTGASSVAKQANALTRFTCHLKGRLNLRALIEEAISQGSNDH